MKMPEFAMALEQITPALTKAQNSGNPEDICTLMLTLAVHGLVIIPIDEDAAEIPQPICYMTYLVGSNQIWNRKMNCYLIPADQIAG